MIDALDDRPSISFWVVGGAALFWNLIGMMLYYMQMTMTLEALGGFTQEQQEFFGTIPIWATSAYAIAVSAGVLGSLFLVLRKAWAAPLFVVSLAGIVVQNLHAFLLGNGLEVFGSQGIILPAIVMAVAIALVFYSRQARGKRWLT